MKNGLNSKAIPLKLTTLGFTLIEILGVISILGIIAIISVPSVEYVINQGKEKAYNTQINSIELAVQDYLTDNKQILGNEYEINLSIEDLKNEGYLDFDFRNPNNDKCFNNNNNIIVTKKPDEKPKYSVEITSEGNEEDCGYFENYPTLLLNGNILIELNLGSEFIDPGFIAYNSDGENVAESVIVSGNVNVNTPGTYELVYSLTVDNLTASKVRKVKIIDTEPPVIEGIGPIVLEKTVETFDILEGVSATDNSGKDVNITTQTNLVLKVPGTYYVEYIAKDSSNNITRGRRDIIVSPGKTDESYFVFENGVIIDYSDEGPKNVIIPNTIRGEKVESIGNSAFYDNDLKNVIIPNSVTSIGDSAFESNLLENIFIPGSITFIGKEAFYYNRLKSIYIPDSVTSIGRAAFVYNDIEEIKFSKSISVLEDRIFNNNNIKNLEIPSFITEIGDEVFSFNDIVNLKIPSSVVKIGDEAFRTNEITKITIPNSVTSIGDYAFFDNELEKLDIPSSINIIRIGSFAYNNISELNIPSSVTNIEYYTFNNNKLPNDKAFIYARNNDGTDNREKLVSYGGDGEGLVVLPSQIKDIGYYAFGRTNVSRVILPDNLEYIDTAFTDTNIDYIEIPASVNYISDSAFNECSLSRVYLPGRTTNDLGEFVNSSNPEIVYGSETNESYFTFEDGVITDYSASGPKDVIIPNYIDGQKVEVIGESSFYRRNLTSVVLPLYAHEIGAYAFENNSIKTIYIPYATSFLDYCAFCNNDLNTIYLRDGEYMDRGDFWYDNDPTIINT